MKIKFLFVFLMVLFVNVFSQNYVLKSPDGKLSAKVENNNGLRYTFSFNETNILENCEIAINIDGELFPSKNEKIINFRNSEIKEKIFPPVSQKTSVIENQCNELLLVYANNIWVDFRAYNNGFAYRIISNFDKQIRVVNEIVDLNFSQNFSIYFPEEESFISHYERIYKYIKLNEIKENQFCSLPALVDCNNGLKIGITESGLYSYPNLFLSGSSSNKLKGIFPKYVIKSEPKESSDRSEIITEDNFISSSNGNRNFPWRIFMVSEKDKELIENQLVYILSDSSVIKETSWIKPGKVAWDWWNALNIYGVDFESGINTNTYKYYIDFANKYGLEYIILDEGWSKTTTNILESNDNLDLKELIEYGKSKNVGVILWVLWKPLDEKLEEVLDLFKELGVKGIKVDFMQRADQKMVEYYEKVLIEAAERHLLVDFHGAYKPSGLFRKYPNYISNEGVKGLENCKWSEEITPAYDCTIPFIRMLAGPMDYTPGAMINSEEGNFKSIFSKPMSQGTRAHQIALYAIYESPLQMLADCPSNYYANPISAEFISKFPTTWDDTHVIDGKVGEFVIVARKKDNVWYIGGITNWTERDLEVKLDFVDKQLYNINLAVDGKNANKYASDIKFSEGKISKGETLKLHLAKGGGFAAILNAVN